MTRALLRTAAVAAALTAAAGCSSSAAPSAGPDTTVAEQWIAQTDDDALFTVDCTFSHRAPDDPIVHPGEPGASHSHEFFGSTATDADSTGAALRGTPTTCEDTDDTAAYWVPTLSLDGMAVEPKVLRAYYRARRGTDVREITAPPLGLAMISGDPNAPAGDHEHGPAPADLDDEGYVVDAAWGCGLKPVRLHGEPPTDCTELSPLTLQLRFPDCWDGRHLDSADHRSHVAVSVDGECPASHPVLMTELQLSVSWPVAGADGGRVTLASGPAAGIHGDYLNGWEPSALAGQVELCVHAKANCTIG